MKILTPHIEVTCYQIKLVLLWCLCIYIRMSDLNLLDNLSQCKTKRKYVCVALDRMQLVVARGVGDWGSINNFISWRQRERVKKAKKPKINLVNKMKERFFQFQMFSNFVYHIKLFSILWWRNARKLKLVQ